MDQPTAVTADRSELDDFLGVKPPSRRGTILKWAAVAVGVVLLVLLLMRLFGSGAEATRYATDTVDRGNLTVTISATGNLQPTNQVDVGSQISGLVTEVNVDNNDRVKIGQVLARIDTSTLRDAIDRSRAALNAAQAQLVEARATSQQNQANLRRLLEVFRLSGGKVPSATELDTGRAEAARAAAGVSSAEAAIAQARAQLASDQTQFNRALIKSPVNGVVLSRQIEPGQTVAASLNAPVLFQIAEDLSQMRLEVKVDEADVGQVAAGQRATFTVDAFPGRTFPARVERVDVGANSGANASSSAASSASTGTVVAYTARLTVDNPDLILRPGMTATAEIVTTEKQNVLLVPNAALRFTPGGEGAGAGGGVTDVLVPRRPRRGNRAERTVTIGRGSRQTVYVLSDTGTPRPIQVVVGDTNGTVTEVSGGGLRPGMKVITGTLAATDGASSGQSGRRSGGRRKAGGQ